ncbi:MAG: pentapeptide repeat-containing protein [Anaerolineae bacterium]|nr:pentapeptide repeat-containing protein [Anaerolineae bacterium]
MHNNRNWWYSLSEATRLRLLIIPILLICTVLPTLWSLARDPDWPGLALNFGTDMGGTLVTFILIDLLLGSREKREAEEREKARLIGQMHSRDNGLTLAAVEELRAHGWLVDGTLRGANLVNANLQGGYLRYANLREVNLHRANCRKTRLGHTDLRGADLEDADFQGADLDEVKLQGAQVLLSQLTQANRLRNAVMPEGERYDGRFNLPGDLKDAEAAGISANDPAAMAEFYGVSLEEYTAGQSWAREHLAVIRGESA